MKSFTTVKLSHLENKVQTTLKSVWLLGLCMLAFIVCIAVCAAPLQREVGVSFLSQMPISQALTGIGARLPVDFHVLPDIQSSKITTGNGEFLLLVVLMFICYGLCFWCIRYRITMETSYTYVLSIIVVAIVASSLIFLFTPALLSYDVFVYADYGRTIVVHHSNPYFVPPLQSSWPDQLTRLDSWNSVVNAYGPLWLYMCSFFALFLGDEPVRYIFAFRVLGIIAHLFNFVLILAIPRARGQSRRTLLLAAFLYGCNPLVLLECCLNAHNDACMITFILLGIWLSLQAEKKDFTRFRHYSPPLIALTMAALIKFISTPLILLFICLLVYKTLIEARSMSVSRRWISVLLNMCIAGAVSGLISLLLYLPFWIGHSIPAIVQSFSLAPSSYASQNSIMRTFVELVRHHGLPPPTSWLYTPEYLLSLHATWSVINIIVLAIVLVIGANLLWHVPTTRSMLLAGLIVFEAVLIVTPWFFSWYVLWIIGLAALLLTERNDTRGKAVILFAFVFSASAFFTYIRPYYLQPFDSLFGVRYLLTDGLPILALLGFFVLGIVRCRNTFTEKNSQQRNGCTGLISSHPLSDRHHSQD